MKIILQRILSCVILICLTVTLLATATNILERKDADYKYQPFFEHASDMDVLFLGNSHVVNAYFPMELWNDYGITSYNMGGHENYIPTTYWVLENALNYAKPKVVVVDCYLLDNMEKTSDNVPYVHLSLDAFPITPTKVHAVYDLFGKSDTYVSAADEDKHYKGTMLEFLWDYSVYHSRWEEISADDFSGSHTLEYGAESRVNLAEPAQMIPNPGVLIDDYDNNVGVQYLKKIIETCQKNNIDVVLAYLPYPIIYENDYKSLNTAAEIAKEYDIDFINYLDEGIVDFETDCHDPDSHLNPSGGFKVTDYTGKFLSDNYNLVDHRGDTHYDYWNEDYRIYSDWKIERLNAVSDINTYLMLLQDQNYGYVIDVGNPSVLQSHLFLEFLKNKGVDTSDISENTRYIVACGKESVVIDSDTNDKQMLAAFDENAFIVNDGVISVNVFEMSDKAKIVTRKDF